jgi:hypothetical protein
MKGGFDEVTAAAGGVVVRGDGLEQPVANATQMAERISLFM